MVGERAPGRGRTKQRKAQNNAFLQVLTDVSISAAALCKHGGAPSVLAEGRPPVCIRRCVFIVSGSVRRDSDLKPTGLVVLKETIHQQSQWRRIPLNMDVCVHLFLHARALFCFFYRRSTSRVNSLQRFWLAVDGVCACSRTVGTPGVMGVRFILSNALDVSDGFKKETRSWLKTTAPPCL